MPKIGEQALYTSVVGGDYPAVVTDVREHNLVDLEVMPGQSKSPLRLRKIPWENSGKPGTARPRT